MEMERGIYDYNLDKKQPAAAAAAGVKAANKATWNGK